MEWKMIENAGLALYINEGLFGWVLKTINNKYTVCLVNKKIDKELFDNVYSASTYLTNILGE